MGSADPKIYLEARIVLYSKNHWRLTGTLPANNIFRSYPQLFRRITFAFNHRDISPALKGHIWKMYATRDRSSDEFKATHEQCLREVLCVRQWPQLLRAMKPHLDLLELDLRGLSCPAFGDGLDLCRQGGLFYNNYLAYLIFTPTVDQGEAQKRLSVGIWGKSWVREHIKKILRPGVQPETSKQPE